MHFRSGPGWPHRPRCVYLIGFDAPAVPNPPFTDSVRYPQTRHFENVEFFPLFIIASVRAVRPLAYKFSRAWCASFACTAPKGACSCFVFQALVLREDRLRSPFLGASPCPRYRPSICVAIRSGRLVLEAFNTFVFLSPPGPDSMRPNFPQVSRHFHDLPIAVRP